MAKWCVHLLCQIHFLAGIVLRLPTTMDVHGVEVEATPTLHVSLIRRRTHFPDDHHFQHSHSGHMDNCIHMQHRELSKFTENIVFFFIRNQSYFSLFKKIRNCKWFKSEIQLGALWINARFQFRYIYLYIYLFEPIWNFL